VGFPLFSKNNPSLRSFAGISLSLITAGIKKAHEVRCKNTIAEVKSNNNFHITAIFLLNFPCRSAFVAIGKA